MVENKNCDCCSNRTSSVSVSMKEENIRRANTNDQIYDCIDDVPPEQIRRKNNSPCRPFPQTNYYLPMKGSTNEYCEMSNQSQYENPGRPERTTSISTTTGPKRPTTLDLPKYVFVGNATENIKNEDVYTEMYEDRQEKLRRITSPSGQSVYSQKRHSSYSNNTKMSRSISVPEMKIKNNTKNENMVLQLVLPGGVNSNHNSDGNYLSVTSLDDILGFSQLKERNRPLNSSFTSHQDLYSPGEGVCGTANGPSHINHGFAGDQGEYMRSFSVESMPQTPAPSTDSTLHKSTPPEERKRVFWHRLTTILSGMYALFIITLGLAVYVTDVIDGNGPIAETYSLYLVIIALIYVLFLILDISYYNYKVKQFLNSIEENAQNEIQMTTTDTGHFQLNIPLPSSSGARKTLLHHYCLSKDHHAANFYLKIGAAVFCFGHLIHSLLLVGYQIMFVRSDSETFEECATLQTLILDIVYPIYSFLLLYFIFKYSNIIINRHVILARFGIMHCIASSICFWVWTIFRETIEALSNHSHSHDKDDHDDSTEQMSEVNFLFDHPIAYALTTYNKRGAQVLTKYLNTTLRRFTEACDLDEGMQKIYQNYSPYLYPFSVEYSILVVGVLYIIWQNVGVCKGTDDEPSTYRCKKTVDQVEKIESNIVVHADFHSANKGLFCGLAVMLLSVVGIILFIITMNQTNQLGLAIKIHTWNAMVVIILMLISSTLAYKQITKLDVNQHYHGLLDDLLLVICIPAFFLNGIFTIIPAVVNGNGMSVGHSILEVLQVLIQSPFIMDGLRRTSNSRQLLKEKPGRELVTFLIVCNVASWVSQTFEVESHGLLDDRYEFYGDELWTILGHMCLPLMMFYRFHSSVCLVDIWKYGYEPPHSD